MTDFIDRIQCKVVITLNDKTEIDLSLKGATEVKNYITSVNILENTSASNQNPVGVVSSNTLKILLKSLDRTLLPDNEESPYFGKMDTSATIKVTIEDVDGQVEFNTFYVSSWLGNISTSSPYTVTIEATDLLSIVNKNPVPNIKFLKNIGTSKFFKDTINELNTTLSDKYKIQYDEEDISFSPYDTLAYSNIDASNMGTFLNTISQSTLTNIYYTREDKLKTDYCLDDTAKESVSNLSDKVNILKASIDRGGLVNYNGVKINCIENTVNSITELTTLSQQVLVPGDNIFEDIDLGNKIYKLGYIKVDSDSKVSVEIKDVSYSKNLVTFTVVNNTQGNVNCSIKVYGQTVKENKRVYTVKKQESSNEILEVTNKILPYNKIVTFANGLVSLVGIKNSALSLSGYFNPRIKLGDTVYVDVESTIKTKGYYKVVQLNWTFSSVVRCEAKVIKTITGGI